MKPFLNEAVDQSLHFCAAAFVVAIVQPPEFWQATFLGFALGFVREVTEHGSPTSAGSLRDLLFWTLGGLCMGLIRAAL